MLGGLHDVYCTEVATRVLLLDPTMPSRSSLSRGMLGDAVSGVAPLAHDCETMQRLERLATACQSGRAVLLEGPTCSGKTALVTELARLAQHTMVTVHLNAESGEESVWQNAACSVLN